jgi:hypothetical protein
MGLTPRWLIVATFAAALAGVALAVWLFQSLA